MDDTLRARDTASLHAAPHCDATQQQRLLRTMAHANDMPTTKTRRHCTAAEYVVTRRPHIHTSERSAES